MRLFLERSVVVAVALAAVGCEAQTFVGTTVEMPSSIAAADRVEKRLHIQITKPIGSFKKLDLPNGECPDIVPTANGFDQPRVTSNDKGFSFGQTAIPSVPEFCAAAWYDTNENGKLDTGDAVGKLAKPYPRQPSRFFSSNRYSSPPIVLELVP